MDREERLDDIHKLQQILYVESPLGGARRYPDSLEVVNSDKWEGWTPFLGGAPFYNAFNVDSYKNLKPKVGREDDSGSNTTTWIIVGVVAARGRHRRHRADQPPRQGPGGRGVSRSRAASRDA